jgi:hypothetical protein
MDLHDETAFFRGADQDCLVAAALSCPMCLSGDVSWRLVPSEYEACAECECRTCGHARTVFLAPEQALRLALHEDRPLDPTPRPEPELVAL